MKMIDQDDHVDGITLVLTALFCVALIYALYRYQSTFIEMLRSLEMMF